MSQNIAEWARVTAGNFGARLRELREGAGLTQQELAEKAGMARIGIAQLEGGRRKPAWQSVLALTKALGATCEEFMVRPERAEALKPGRPPKARVDDTGKSTVSKRRQSGAGERQNVPKRPGKGAQGPKPGRA